MSNVYKITTQERFTSIEDIPRRLDLPGNDIRLLGNTRTQLIGVVKTKNGKTVRLEWPLSRTLARDAFDMTFHIDYVPSLVSSSVIDLYGIKIHTPANKDFRFSGNVYFPGNNLVIPFTDVVRDVDLVIHEEIQLPVDLNYSHPVTLTDLHFKSPTNSTSIPISSPSNESNFIVETNVFTYPESIGSRITFTESQWVPTSFEKHPNTYFDSIMVYSLPKQFYSFEQAKYMASKDESVTHLIDSLNHNRYYLTKGAFYGSRSVTFAHTYVKGVTPEPQEANKRRWVLNYEADSNVDNGTYMFNHSDVNVSVIDHGNISSYFLEPQPIPLLVPYIEQQQVGKENQFLERIHQFDPSMYSLFSNEDTTIFGNAIALLERDWGTTLFRGSSDVHDATYMVHQAYGLQLFVLFDIDTQTQESDWSSQWYELTNRVERKDNTTGLRTSMRLYQYHADISYEPFTVRVTGPCIFFTSPTMFTIDHPGFVGNTDMYVNVKTGLVEIVPEDSDELKPLADYNYDPETTWVTQNAPEELMYKIPTPNHWGGIPAVLFENMVVFKTDYFGEGVRYTINRLRNETLYVMCDNVFNHGSKPVGLGTDWEEVPTPQQIEDSNSTLTFFGRSNGPILEHSVKKFVPVKLYKYIGHVSESFIIALDPVFVARDSLCRKTFFITQRNTQRTIFQQRIHTI
jgi:hypothetical protein